MTGVEQWLGGAAILGILAACWSRLKILTWRIANLLIVKVRLEGDVGNALACLCWNEFKRSPLGEKRFNSTNDFVQTVGRYQVIGYELVGMDPQVFWKNWTPLVLYNSAQALEGGGNAGLALTVCFIRGSFNLDKLLVASLDRLNELRHGGDKGSRFRVVRKHGNGSRGKRNSRTYEEGLPSKMEGDSPVDPQSSFDHRYLKWSRHEIGLSNGGKNPFGILCYPPEVLNLVEHCRRWYNSESWYKSKEIPWRLGVLLYGGPGTGKTSLVRAIGRELNLPVFSYDLASFGNQDFESGWQSMMSNAPCIALLEDIDTVFDGRENRLGEEGGGLTFDCLLNCIGGIKDASGVLTFVTTNRPECLDPALGRQDEDRGVSTRPGRIDVVLSLGLLDDNCRVKLACKILSDCPKEIERLVKEGNGDSGAQFSERCSRVALEHYWNSSNQNGEISHERINLQAQK